MLPLLTDARALTTRGIAVTLLTDHPLLYYSGMVPEYLGGVYGRHQITVDLVGRCTRAGVRFFPGRARSLDPRKRTVVTADGATLSYDMAAFDIGAVNPHRTHAPHAIFTKPLNKIETLQKRVTETLNNADASLRVVIVGGGAAGTEVALNLSARAQAVRPNALHLVVIEPADTLLPGFPAGMQRYARQLLAQRGVDIRTGTAATRTTVEEVVLDSGETIACDVALWATGSAGPPLFKDAGLPITEQGFVRVAQTLQVEGHPRLFAAGDCAAVQGYESLARVGVHAVKQGPVLARNVIRAAHLMQEGRAAESLDKFKPYPLTPLILSTGLPDAMWTARKLWFHGRPMLRLKHAVDRRWMRKYQTIDHYSGLLDAQAALAG